MAKQKHTECRRDRERDSERRKDGQNIRKAQWGEDSSRQPGQRQDRYKDQGYGERCVNGAADKAANLARWKSLHRQLPGSDG